MDTKVVSDRVRRMPPNAGKGRPKGAQNKVTVEFRETVTKLLSDTSHKVPEWLASVAEGEGDRAPDPAKALDLLAKLADFAAPRLARTDVAVGGSDDMPPIKQVTKIELVAFK